MRSGAVNRSGICHIWFRGRHISPSMPYREARSVSERSEWPTASKSDRTSRNPGMSRLVRRSSATSGGIAFFSLIQTFCQRMRKCSGSPIRTIPLKDAVLFTRNSVDCAGINVNVRTARIWSSGDRGERWSRADWVG